jgi:hypothetical protein
MKNIFKQLPGKNFGSEPVSCKSEKLGSFDDSHYHTGSDSSLGRNWIKLKFPKIRRKFKESELEILGKCKFRSKNLNKSSCQANDRIKTFICLIENNPKDKKGYTHIPSKFLGKLFKSQQMVSNIFECLISGGILEVDKYYYREAGISKGYRLSLKFKICETIYLLRKKLKIIKMRKLEYQDNIVEFDLSKDNDCLIDQTLDGVDKEYQDIIKNSLSSFTRNRFTQRGLDPNSKKECICCKVEYPNVMFSISPKNDKINIKCKICWYDQVKENKDIVDQLNILNNIVNNLPSNKFKIKYTKRKA